MPLLLFYIAILIYSSFSSPTPDNTGFFEYLVAACLIISVCSIRLWNVLTCHDLPSYLSFHRTYILYMFCIPLIIGVIAAHPLNDIFRDLVPVAFLVLPLCFYGKAMPRLDVILMMAGAFFALRYLSTFLLSGHTDSNALLYLANSPLVPFACIIGFHYFTLPDTRFILLRIIGLLICVVCMLAMAAMLQRAPVILSVAACLFILSLRLPSHPLKMGTIALVIICLLYPFLPFIVDTFTTMVQKTASVGFNNRAEEWQAMILQGSFWGEGWGAIWQSPAVADIWVRYTHNIISYYWLKAGVLGVMLTLVFIFLWGRQIIILIRHNLGIGIAIAVPFIIHVTLYTGFKTLDFALILTLLTLRDVNCSEINSNHQSRVSADNRGDRAGCMRSSPSPAQERP